MNWFEALILGILQGLTEFLPVSSSGHLEIGKVLLGVDAERSLIFTVAVHGATVLSTVFVFRKDIGRLFMSLSGFRWGDDTRYIVKLLLSMIPVVILGIFFMEEIEALFTGNLYVVGGSLLATGLLLLLANHVKKNERSISYADSFIIGIAQAMAVLPGLSRSGATISTGLLLRNKREEVTRFSFLMVLIPVIGANLKDAMDIGSNAGASGVPLISLLVGSLAAFLSGVFACRAMIGLVRKGRLIYFALYCFCLGLFALLYQFIA
jgi:undecaprenyl-diphosphatase